MEAGTNLAKLGLPVGFVVRIRPLLPDEQRAGEIRITDNQRKIILTEPGKLQGTAEDEYYADYCYAEGEFADIHERSIMPLINRDPSGIPGFIDGVNCAILSFGITRSGKTYTIEGSGRGGQQQYDGVIPSVIRGIFEALQSKLNEQQQGGRFGARGSTRRWRHKLSLQYIEVVNEQINDLLNPQKMELEVNEQGISEGLGIRNLARKWVDSEEEAIHHFKVGQSGRTTFRGEFGPMSDRATAVFCIELHQVTSIVHSGQDKAVEEHLFSRFLIFDLPGAEKLSEDPTTVRIREGAKLNNSMLGFGQVVKSLALARDNLHDAEFVDFKQSVLTSLLPDILGGSTRSLIVTTIPPADYKANSFTLQFAQLFRQLRSFPIVNDGRQMALARKLSNQLHLMRQQIAASSGRGLDVSDQLTDHLMTIHKLEKKIIEDENVRVALLEEREQLRERVAQVNARVNGLLVEKGQLQQERIASEEEKLKVSKVLIDLQIENASLLEQAVDKEFQLENKLLQQENDIMELEMAVQARQKKIETLERQHVGDLELIEDMRSELAAVRSNYASVLHDLDAEKARCEELSIELLNLVNAKNSLLRECEQVRSQRDNLLNMSSELENGLARAQRELKEAESRKTQLEREVDNSRMEKERALIDLDAARLQNKEEKLMGERKATAIEQDKGHEVLSLRAELSERNQEAKKQLQRLEEEMSVLRGRERQASRRAVELEDELQTKAVREAELVEETTDVREKLAKLSEDYRERLHKYISDVSHLSTEAARRETGGGGAEGSGISELRSAVDTMFHELVQTYVEREAASSEELRRARDSALSTLKKNRRLYQAYRSLRYQLEDLAPAGVSIQLLDDASLQVEGDVGDVERQQRLLIEELRDKLLKAETTAVTKSERALKEAEKFTQKAAQMQADISQQKSTISKLEQEKAHALEDARSKHGEVQRLQHQLLQELHELKARGIQASTAPASAAAGAADDGQLRELRRELDRVSVENDRLRGEVEKLRRAAAVGGASEKELAAKDTEIASLKTKVSRLEGELRAAKAAPAGTGDKEIAALRAEVARLKSELENDDLKGMISAFASGTQADLEKEVMELRTQARGLKLPVYAALSYQCMRP